jgi:lipopolysaccharide transport system permease protein
MKAEVTKEYYTIIKPKKSNFLPDFNELWGYRELFFFLAWRNISIRYKQTALGILWAAIQPIVIMVVFSVIFGKVAKLPDDGIPYPLLVMAGTLAWQFFSTALTQASGSVTGNAGMVQKIYFPRLILPFGSLLSSLVDFLIAFVIFVILLIYYAVMPTYHIVYLPLFILLLFFTTASLSLWFSALNVAYRDVKIMIPFILRVGLYISPVGFLSTNIPEKYQLLYSLNPLVGILDGFRWCLLGGTIVPNWEGLLYSSILVVFLFFSGLAYFAKTEKSFADII